VRLWEFNEPVRQAAFHGHQHAIWGVGFSADGRRAVSAAFDQTVRIWDVANRRELLRCTANAQPLWAAVMTPDGRRVAAGGDDAVVYLWAVPP
jgi:WD40 repeat protein